MFPKATPQDFLACSSEQKLKWREAQERYALDFLLSSRHTLIGDEEKLIQLSEKIFWASYVRVPAKHLPRLLRMFPQADRMLAKYGMDKEEILQIFLDHLCSLLLGVPFENHHDIKDAMERQAQKIFDTLDRQMERAHIPMKAFPSRATLREAKSILTNSAGLSPRGGPKKDESE